MHSLFFFLQNGFATKTAALIGGVITMKLKITKETIGSMAKFGGMVILYGLAAMVSRTNTKDVIDNVRYSGDVKYGDAISAIMDSDMFDSNKNRAMEMLKKNGESDYYRAVIKIIRSDMFDSSKIKAITILCEEES